MRPRPALAALTAVAALALVLAPPAQGRDAIVRSFDGTPLITHFYPAKGIAAGSRVPTVLHAHGWGFFGSVDTESGVQPIGGGGIRVGDMLRAGFNVLTWDARGFGGSGGTAMMNSAAFEGRDVQTLIGHVARQPEALLDAVGDPRVGMVGSSYGGGIQLVAAAIDKRIDAIVPDSAWNSLATSFERDRSVKTAYGLALAGSGLVTGLGGGLVSPAGIQLGTFDPRFGQGFAEAALTGSMRPASRDYLTALGPGARVSRITAPTLLTQGTVDTIFPLREAIENYRLLRRAGTPVKMIWHCGGHGTCEPPGERPGTVEDAVLRWFSRWLWRNPVTSTGPAFEWVDDHGGFHGSADYPLVARIPITVTRRPRRTIRVGAASSGQVDAALPAPRAYTRVTGAPAVEITYRGRGTPAHNYLYASVVETARRRVLGHQETPIPVVLDGRTRTVRRSLEVIATASGPTARLAVRLGGNSLAYGPERGDGTITVESVSAELPVGESVRARARGRASLRLAKVRRVRAARIRRARGRRRFRLCAPESPVRSVTLVVKRGGRAVARSRRFSVRGCARPRVRGWRAPAPGRHTVIATGRDGGGRAVRAQRHFRVR